MSSLNTIGPRSPPPQPLSSAPPQHKKDLGLKIFLSVLLVCTIGGIGYYIYLQTQKTEQEKKEPPKTSTSNSTSPQNSEKVPSLPFPAQPVPVQPKPAPVPFPFNTNTSNSNANDTIPERQPGAIRINSLNPGTRMYMDTYLVSENGRFAFLLSKGALGSSLTDIYAGIMDISSSPPVPICQIFRTDKAQNLNDVYVEIQENGELVLRESTKSEQIILATDSELSTKGITSPPALQVDLTGRLVLGSETSLVKSVFKDQVLFAWREGTFWYSDEAVESRSIFSPNQRYQLIFEKRAIDHVLKVVDLTLNKVVLFKVYNAANSNPIVAQQENYRGTIAIQNDGNFCWVTGCQFDASSRMPGAMGILSNEGVFRLQTPQKSVNIDLVPLVHSPPSHMYCEEMDPPPFPFSVSEKKTKKNKKQKTKKESYKHPISNWIAGFSLFYGLWGLLDDVKRHTVDKENRESYKDALWYGAVTAAGIGIVASEPGKFMKNFENV